MIELILYLLYGQVVLCHVHPVYYSNCKVFRRRAGHYDCIQNIHSYTHISKAHVLKPAGIRETVDGML